MSIELYSVMEYAITLKGDIGALKKRTRGITPYEQPIPIL